MPGGAKGEKRPGEVNGGDILNKENGDVWYKTSPQILGRGV
jgi:hypothetical protein